jgi:hypothetical protein
MRVRDLEAAVTRLAAGARLVGGPLEISKGTTNILYVAEKVDPKIRHARKPGKKPWRIAVFSDPDGVIIELNER